MDTADDAACEYGREVLEAKNNPQGAFCGFTRQRVVAAAKAARDDCRGSVLVGRTRPRPRSLIAVQSPLPEQASGSETKASIIDANRELSDPVARSKLHDVCVQLLGRDLEPGDVTYTMREVDGGHVAKVRLPGFSGSWISGVCANKRAARQLAASTALRSLLADAAREDHAELSMAVSRVFGPAYAASTSSTARPTDLGSMQLGLTQSGDGESSEHEAKTQLVIFCQRSCGRPMSKNDIVYTTVRDNCQYQTTVVLNCFGGQEFRGGLKVDRKQSEQAAAEVALLALPKKRSQGTSTPAASSKKRRVSADEVTSEIDPGIKRQLHDACTKILGRPPQAGDIVYEVVAGNTGPTATLQLPCLPGDLRERIWVSPVSVSRHDARIKAANMAMRSLLDDPVLGAMVK
mmetsp:Transcript_54346/g.151360  ORF Transcript_54346/g.151360 Transcript_54346/m.151360 type:complete len:405 (-) Transcript_54346:65-1279(-)